MASPVTSTSAQVLAARRLGQAASRGTAAAWRRTLHKLAALGLPAILAACSTAPMHNGGGGSPLPYVRTEPAPASRPAGLPEFVDHSVGEEEISIEAMSLVGIPYRWGGNTPDSGFDCSGLVKYVVLRAASVNLPRTTSQLEYAGTAIAPDQIAPGDLIFFDTDGRPYSHVGIYVGHYRFVNAPSTGGTVRIDYVTNPYWARHFDGIRRVAIGHPAPFQSAPIEAATPTAPPAVAATAMARPSRIDDVNAAPDPRADDAGNTENPPARSAAVADNDPSDGGASLTIPLYSGQRTVAAPLDNNDSPAAPADDNAQPDPIAQIANLSGAGSPPTPAPAPAPTHAAPASTSAQAADPIAAFADNKL